MAAWSICQPNQQNIMLTKIKKAIQVWFENNKEIIKYELASIGKTFLGGVALYASLNWELIQDTGIALLTAPESVERAVIFGILAAAFRSGVKAVIVLIKPQVNKLLGK